MEIKSNNVLIGLFSLLTIIGIFLFSFWLARVELDQEFNYFQVVFDESVSGLTDGGLVQYNGIAVGQVVDLALDSNDPSKVIALIQVEAETPVKIDTTASLTFTGVTGVALIQLEGGSPEAVRLTPKEGQRYAVIIAEPSAFQELFSSAPAVLENANQLILNLHQLVAQNQENVSKIVGNIETLTGELANSSADIKQALANVNKITADVAAATSKLESLATTGDELLKGDGKQLVREARLALTSFRKIGEDLEAVVADNRGTLDGFARDGLGEVPQLIEETKQLVATLERISQRAEENPGQFLLGNDVVEYEAPR